VHSNPTIPSTTLVKPKSLLSNPPGYKLSHPHKSYPLLPSVSFYRSPFQRKKLLLAVFDTTASLPPAQTCWSITLATGDIRPPPCYLFSNQPTIIPSDCPQEDLSPLINYDTHDICLDFYLNSFPVPCYLMRLFFSLQWTGDYTILQ